MRCSAWRITKEKLPKNWNSLPIGPESVAVGKKWLDDKQFPILEVPSTIVPIESNFVLNPLHSDFSLLEKGKPEAIRIDPRIANLLGKTEAGM
ncbi:hypothetical protein DSCO28_57730 [Desulfosarcina ovata subsp. sediminis]|uniref:RES domain-containing protein n=1 Tax=Desulfosarcina ovata subsp. sediminis TaxID=885957 RepID=A0A5K7ZY56_9BACT|nr:hypothetical protein [Desulfosarcina ovata]BBO85207.1 hypothetical protein DSCO28_57730 [Desulfosarcina ovata subsp. sediminis]